MCNTAILNYIMGWTELCNTDAELTSVRSNAFEFILVDVHEQRSTGFVSGIISALFHIISLTLRKYTMKG